MDEAKRKLMADAEKEIDRFCGGGTEYQAWVRDSATPYARKLAPLAKLMHLAQEKNLPVTEEQKSQFKHLQWFVDMVTLASNAIVELGEIMESSIGHAMPLPMFELLTVRYAGVHRIAYTLWLQRDDHKFPSSTGDLQVN